MKKVVFSITNVRSKSDKKLSGFGYLTEGNLLCPCISKNNKPYIRIFEDVEKAFKDVDISDESPKFLKRIWVNNFGDSNFPAIVAEELGAERFSKLHELLMRLSNEGVVVNDNR